ncbi:MAG: hypothetical protein FWD41_03225, partial [Actinomycetia bacterium]|nr:hypothetical protein [Actinomycetes bacterium]
QGPQGPQGDSFDATAFNELVNRVSTLEQQVVSLQEQINAITTLVELLSVTHIPMSVPFRATTGTATPAEVCVIQTGYMHNFWGSGALDHQVGLTNNTTYYLMNMIAPSYYLPLTYYQGASTIGTLWIIHPNGSVIANYPLHADAGGLWFRTSGTDTLPIGTTMQFTLMLILVPPTP